MSNGHKQNYCKPALTIEQQIDLLVSRGLTIPDRDKALHYLNYIGYHRLSGYFLTFQQNAPGVEPHSFKKNVTFKNILDIYIFDRELRLHTLTYLRNLCAHHARLWNRQFSIKPTIMRAYQKQLGRNYTFYAQAAMLYVLMYVIADGSKWQRRLAEMLDKHPNVFIRAMGFPENWKEDPFWRMV